MMVFCLGVVQTNAQDKLKNEKEVVVQTYINSKWIPDSMFNLRIVAGKKIEVISLNSREMDLSTNNYRQALRKTPGIFVSDHDASGLQTSIATRGLSANRSWEFNMRQNGYDIASDPSGYPEAYYSPTLDAVAAIHVYRGSSALQYGSQFGGMINYQLKDQIGDRPISYEGSQTAGSFGLFNSFNAIGGKKGKWSYYGFMHHRQSKGFRLNSHYYTHNYFGKIGYDWKGGKITAEYTNSYYLSQQAGGLHDSIIASKPDTSIRARNWFELPWKIASIQLSQQFNNGLKLHASINYLHGKRNSVGFLKAINIPDTFNTTLNAYNHRDVDKDIYNTISSELRFNYGYKLGNTQHAITGGARYCLSDIQRMQKGIGSGNMMDDFSVTADFSGNLYQKDLDLQTQNFALFAENLFQIGKRISLSPGYRIENIQSTVSGRSNTVAGGFISPMEKKRWIFLGGLSAKFNVISQKKASLILYANGNQNYRPVTYSELLPASTTEIVDPLLSDATGYSSEGGFKGFVLLRNRCLWSYDANVFYLKYNNKIGTLPFNNSSLKTNIGDLASKGIEFYSEWMFMNPFFTHSKKTEQLNLYLSGTVLNAHYTRWNNPSIAGNSTTSIVGKKAEYAPNQIIRTGVEYKYNTIAISYQIQYNSSCFSDAANTITPNNAATVGLIPANVIHDAALNITLNDSYNLKAGVNNLLNTVSIMRRTSGYPGPGALSNQGRSFYLSFTVKF